MCYLILVEDTVCKEQDSELLNTDTSVERVKIHYQGNISNTNIKKCLYYK